MCSPHESLQCLWKQVLFFLHIYIIKNKLISMIMKLHFQKKANFAQGHHSYMVFVDTRHQPLNLPIICYYEKHVFLSVDTMH